MSRPASGLLVLLLTFGVAGSVCGQATTEKDEQNRPGQAAFGEGHEENANRPSGTARGMIEIDAVAVDGSGKLVTGLQSQDFTLLDNGYPRPIVSFHAFDEGTRPDPPVKVILLVDTVDLPIKMALHEGREVERFLRQNGGKLANPVSIYELSNDGMWAIGKPSLDGNSLAEELADFREPKRGANVSTDMRGTSLSSLTFAKPPALAGLKALGAIATSERGKPGRKLLIWVGPGWGMGTGTPFPGTTNREQVFNAIQWFSTLLREARVTLFTLSEGETVDKSGTFQSAYLYQEFVGGVRSAKQARADYLDRRVLAVESGGEVLDPHKDLATSFGYNGYGVSMSETASRATEITHEIVDFDLVSQINRCVGQATAFYTLSFNPVLTTRQDDYHELKVLVDRPGLTVRTNTGYYDQPYFYDRPNPDRPDSTRRVVTTAELQDLLKDARGKRDSDMAREMDGLQLSERLSDEEAAALQKELRGAKSRAALDALAEASEFLDPPAADIPAEAPPAGSAQQRMIALMTDYLNTTLRRLPDLFATRTTIRYEETPEHYDDAGHHAISFKPLHRVGSSKETVLYRNGYEIAEVAGNHASEGDAAPQGLNTKGTFGSILGAARDAAAEPGGLTWSRWERNASGGLAVFRYVIPESRSRFQVSYCCLPYGDGTSKFRLLAGYHGEIAINPKTGAILRLTVISDLKQNLQLYRADTESEYGPAGIEGMPLIRSDTLVQYGPVSIGGKTYICPIKSISISRSRTIRIFRGLAGEFRTFGPFATYMNVVTFGNYHVFRAESRILP